MSAEEEARVLAYRQAEERRRRFQMELDAALAGDDTARLQLRDRWQPLVVALRHRKDREPDRLDHPQRA